MRHDGSLSVGLLYVPCKCGKALYCTSTCHPDVEKSGKVKNIAMFLNDPMSKPWLHFRSNVLGVFDKFSIHFRMSSNSLIHRIQGETARLLSSETARHNFKSPLWHIFSFLDPHQSTHITISLFDDIEKEIPIAFD